MRVCAPATAFPLESNPSTVSAFGPASTGTWRDHVATAVQRGGYATPLILIVFTSTGAVPVSVTRFWPVAKSLPLLLVIANAGLPLCAATAERRDCCRVAIQLLTAVGAATVRPLATKAAYLASITGPILTLCMGPSASSLNARR